MEQDVLREKEDIGGERKGMVEGRCKDTSKQLYLFFLELLQNQKLFWI